MAFTPMTDIAMHLAGVISADEVTTLGACETDTLFLTKEDFIWRARGCAGVGNIKQCCDEVDLPMVLGFDIQTAT